jgi:hypothetical protein
VVGGGGVHAAAAAAPRLCCVAFLQKMLNQEKKVGAGWLDERRE